MKNPCVAHRGWSGSAPENTMAAIRMALEAPDVDWIEIDVQLSKDEVPVVIHDYKLRRTTNGRGEVKSWTAAELASLDAGGWFSPQFRGESIPTLREVLMEAKGKCRVNIELKTDGVRYPRIEEIALETVIACDMLDEIVFTSFHMGTLQRLRQLHQDVRIGLILDGWRSTLIRELQEMGADFLSIGFSKLDKYRMEQLHAAGIETMAWTVNDIATIRKVASLHPELMICTNYPERWRAAMEDRSAVVHWLAAWFKRLRK
ncbi:glycerophosphodiester phosphodiesterase [Paenibacillus sp. GCM10027627]|uniref:glycerophosphodiester phosphodiesterase n=1 Tax=unclassified Paenibacillus TaxID=185978 RepID=UPI0036383478